MARVHLLNVDPGDCTIIQHNGGRVSMIDICDGNIPDSLFSMLIPSYAPVHNGQDCNFRMCTNPTNPLRYLSWVGITNIWRFILTHPDMDHVDGLNALLNQVSVDNYWDTGSRRDKPPFNGGCYLEADWDRYVRVRDGNDGPNSLLKLAGAQFQFANSEGGDGLHILAPNQALVNDCNMNDDINDGSYVMLYRADRNRILLPGDAHDNTWNYISQTSYNAVRNAGFMLAPHHGRDSQRSYDFLDMVRPGLTLIGSAPSEYIDYNQWSNRGLEYITSNQCGNVILETSDDYIAVYVQNVDFAISRGAGGFTNGQGYAFLRTISAVPE